MMSMLQIFVLAQAAAAPVAAPVVPRPMPGYGGSAPPVYGPPVAPEDRMEWLEQRYGASYGRPKGTGMQVGGGLALGFGAVMGLGTLACVFTAAAQYDAGDREAAGQLRGISIGLGVAMLASVGAGVPLVIVGKRRKQAYRRWLLGQPTAMQPRLAVGAGGLTLRF